MGLEIQSPGLGGGICCLFSQFLEGGDLYRPALRVGAFFVRSIDILFN